METIVRTDLIFSFWILVWLLLYFMHIVTIAPKFLVLVGVVVNIVLVVILMMSKSSFYYIFRFFFINFWIKIFPLYFLFDVSITYTELVYSFLLFIVYLLWLYANNQTFYNVYNTIIHVKKYNDTTTFAHIYDTVYNYISKLMNQML